MKQKYEEYYKNNDKRSYNLYNEKNKKDINNELIKDFNNSSEVLSTSNFYTNNNNTININNKNISENNILIKQKNIKIFNKEEYIEKIYFDKKENNNNSHTHTNLNTNILSKLFTSFYIKKEGKKDYLNYNNNIFSLKKIGNIEFEHKDKNSNLRIKIEEKLSNSKIL